LKAVILLANKLQKFIFNLSTMSPLIVVLTVVCWLQLDLPPLFDEDHLKFQIQVHQAVLLAIGLLFLALSLYGSFFLNKCKKRLERVPIAVSSASCNDTWAIVVLITYVLPIASFALKDFNPWIAGSVKAGGFFAPHT
jgi:hypothetical protein